MRSFHFPPFVLLVLALLVAPATGQCPLQWLPGPQLSGTDERIFAVCEWDPDGAGPRTPVIVAGGKFVVAGSVIANRIAAYDPATSSWSGFGTGMNGDVLALAVLPSGDLVAAGSFTAAGGNPANQIARWDGSSWSPLGTGTTGPVRALAVLPNGDLVAGGSFVVAGGAFVSNIARWNGLAWAAFGIGVNNGVNNTVHALATLPNGDLVTGGDFTIAGGAAASRVARWNGASWSSLGAGTTSSVRSLVARPNGFLVAGLQNIPSLVPPLPPKPVVLEWDGSAWTVLLTVPSVSAAAIGGMVILPSGDIAVAGVGVQSWNGATWSVLAATSNVTALALLANGALVAGGRFFSIGGVNVENVALWNGTAWSATGPAPGPTGVSLPMLAAAGGDLVGVVHFGDNSTSIGRWIGNTWSPFGGAFPYATVTDIALHPSGDVIAGGTFTSAGGTPANRVARWNGTAWSPLGSGIDGLVWAVATLPNGDIVVAGDFLVAGGVPANGVARWNGTAWSPLGTLNGVRTLLALPNGDLLAGCGLPAAFGVMRWNGSSWSPLGTLPIYVNTLALLPDGDVVAGGAFTQPGPAPLDHIARWNGAAWVPLGSGMGPSAASFVSQISVLPDGGLIAVGDFDTAGGIPVPNVARWNGSVWSSVVSAVSPGVVHAVGIPQQGGIVLAGSFVSVDGRLSARIARLAPTCPAAATPSGTGCAGSGGPNVLAAQTLPWCGSTYRTIATGMPANSLALGAYGATTTAIALPAILPQGAAGCALLVVPDVLEVVLPAAGAAQTQLAIPNTVSLVGLVLHQQLVALDLGTGGSIVSVTSTNRLTLTIGAF